MDWTVYWFMLPVCIVVASVAMFSGISGAAMLIPVFLLGFPLFDVPRLTTVEAVGTSLFLETSGFGTGVTRYLRMRLVDTVTAKRIIAVTLPIGALGAVVARQAPVQALQLGYGAAMLALAWMLARPAGAHARPEPALVPAGGSDTAAADNRIIRATSGTTYEYQARGLGLQRVFSGTGALMTGLISTGVGELTLPPLCQRSRFPVAVAAATSTVIVAGTVVGAATTHLVQLAAEGGLSAIPWDLIVWAVPGAITGALIGTRLQGRVSERASHLFFAALFATIGVTFLVAFTVFRDTFA